MNKLVTFLGGVCLIGSTEIFSCQAQSLPTPASEFPAISSGFYHIDQRNHLVVVNQEVAKLPLGSQQINGLALDAHYEFEQAATSLEVGQAYPATCQGTRYTVYFTQLPVVRLAARTPIVDAPSVHATFQLTEPGGTQISGHLGIELRGGFSQSQPKKSYELSFWADTLGKASQEVALLGMRTDDKWNLQALYNEPLRVNNTTAWALWQELHQPYYKAKEPEAKSGIAQQYVEVFLNNTYQGIYALTERIDRKQLKLKKYANGVRGELYKGVNWDEGVTFSSAPPFDNTNEYWAGFEYKYPDEKIDWANLAAFVGFVQNSSDANFAAQVASKFQLASAVDYYLFLNVMRATDNGGKNLYIAKYNAGEPYFFVPWDLDGVLGNNWFGAHDPETADILSNNFFRRLNQDCSVAGFRPLLVKRWAQLRTSVFTEEHILAKYRAAIALLQRNGAYEREHLAWPAYTYSDTELDYVTNWLHRRLAYLDGVFGQSCSSVLSTAASQAATGLQLYPNPATDYVTVQSETGNCRVSIRDTRGQVVLQTTLSGRENKLALHELPKGLYVVVLTSDHAVRVEKLVRE